MHSILANWKIAHTKTKKRRKKTNKQANNKKRRLETAITCYHNIGDTDANSPAKRHKIMIDTGANVTLLRKDKEHGMHHRIQRITNQDRGRRQEVHAGKP
jgi:hypothetical protein